MDILSYTAVGLSAAIKEGKVTAVDAMEAVLTQMDRVEKDIHAYVTVDREKALSTAAKVQEQIQAGTLTGALAGVPVAMKDNLCTEGMLTTCSSKILENFIPTFSAQAVVNLEKAGAVIIGKTNMDEFAMGSTTETSAFGVTKNPRKSITRSGRLIRRLGCGCSCKRMFLRTWQRYGGVYPAASRLLWCCRYEADLWHGFTLWTDCLWFVARSDWAADKGCHRLCGGFGYDCVA